MATADRHRRKAEKNRDFLSTIDVAAHPEWAATVAFYVAVHRAEQLRAAAGHGDSRDHTDRREYLFHHWPAVHDPYARLDAVSRLARYESVGDFFRHYTADDVAARVVGGWLAEVERRVADALAGLPGAP